jgi:hypothetical protein
MPQDVLWTVTRTRLDSERFLALQDPCSLSLALQPSSACTPVRRVSNLEYSVITENVAIWSVLETLLGGCGDHQPHILLLRFLGGDSPATMERWILGCSYLGI